MVGGVDVVITAVAVLSHRGQAMDNAKRGGADNARLCHWYRDDDNKNGWDLPLPHAAGTNATDMATPPLARPLQPTTKSATTKRTADNTTRGEGRTKQQERSVDNARQQRWQQQQQWGCCCDGGYESRRWMARLE